MIRFAGNLVTNADGEINEIEPATIEIGQPVQVVFRPDRRRVPPPLGPRRERAGHRATRSIPGGVGDYPIKVGSMLLTLVDPHPGFEVAYNRWYERDHFYAGCMIGPWLFAGSRWVATRDLKDRRWPSDDETVACPPDAGSYVAIYLRRARPSRRSLQRLGPPPSERAVRRGTRVPRTPPHPHDPLRPPRRGVPRRRPGSDRTGAGCELRRDRARVVRRARRRRVRTTRRAHDAEPARRNDHRVHELVDAVTGRERAAERTDGSRQQGRRS